MLGTRVKGAAYSWCACTCILYLPIICVRISTYLYFTLNSSLYKHIAYVHMYVPNIRTDTYTISTWRTGPRKGGWCVNKSTPTFLAIQIEKQVTLLHSENQKPLTLLVLIKLGTPGVHHAKEHSFLYPNCLKSENWLPDNLILFLLRPDHKICIRWQVEEALLVLCNCIYLRTSQKKN